MTIEDGDKIDLLGVNKERRYAMLSISDHLPWDEDGAHFSLIERKLGSYLRFIRSGQIWEHMKNADRNEPVRIDLVYKYPPTPSAERFLSQARKQLHEEEGIEFSWEGLPDKG